MDSCLSHQSDMEGGGVAHEAGGVGTRTVRGLTILKLIIVSMVEDLPLVPTTQVSELVSYAHHSNQLIPVEKEGRWGLSEERVGVGCSVLPAVYILIVSDGEGFLSDETVVLRT